MHIGSESSTWTAGALPTNFRELHLEQSPETPYAIPEFQGGAIAYWGGSWDLDQCAALIGPEAERVFYKNNFGFGINIFNLYMVRLLVSNQVFFVNLSYGIRHTAEQIGAI